jgi:ABC-type transport system substrate-binding protein
MNGTSTHRIDAPAPSRIRLPCASRRAGAARIAHILAAMLLLAAGDAVGAPDPNKVLRVASPDIETLDPQQWSDDPSFQVQDAIFEGLYEWHYLASPPRLAPLTATALPEITDGGKTWTIRVKPGIYFTDDPAFRGKPRELVAADYVYSLKRVLDPNLARGGYPAITDIVVGAREVVDAASRPGAAFDYDRPIAGLRALDRYTLQLKLIEPYFPLVQAWLTYGAAAREVVDAAGSDIRSRAVGTGPYRLREWKRGSRIVLEANPAYRALRFPESSDPVHAALERSMQGRTLPQIGVIEITVIDEDLPRLLEFDRGRLDVIVLRGEVANRPLADGRLKPEYAARGITRLVFPEPYVFSFYFNMADPGVGGMDNERVALRRAVALGIDVASLARVVYAGHAIPANQMIPPGVTGHDPALPPKSSYDPAAANALLDRFGYVRRDMEGFRLRPDGTPLTLTLSLRSGAVSREISTLWKKDMRAIGVRMEFHLTPFQEMIKEIDSGKFQVCFAGFGGNPSGYIELFQLYSKAPRVTNYTRFALPAYDALTEDFLRSEHADRQIALARKMREIALAYQPMISALLRLENDYVQPWLLGYAPPLFNNYWKYLDIDVAKRSALTR